MVTSQIPQRGDIWWVTFPHSTGSEIQKKRPAIIISNNNSNKYLSRYQIIPLTSNIEKLYPGESYVHVKKKKSKALTSQIVSIDKERLLKFEAKVSEIELTEVEESLKIQLGLI